MSVEKLPEVWAAEKYLRVLDPDGWRGPSVKQWHVEITETEFDERAAHSTVQLLPGHPARLVPPPSNEAGYVVLALADDLLEVFDADDESLDLIDVYDWLVRRARELGAR